LGSAAAAIFVQIPGPWGGHFAWRCPAGAQGLVFAAFSFAHFWRFLDAGISRWGAGLWARRAGVGYGLSLM